MLNAQQKKAVTYNKGPLLIVAGAGTGKTTVIVEKIKYLITEKQVKPEHILALTFTEKAAAEMEERVDTAVPYGLFQMSIATFHSFADQILRTHIGHIGHDPGYTIMTSAESVAFLKRHIFDLDLHYFRPLGNPTKFLQGMLQHFDRLRDEDIDPKSYLGFVKQIKPDAERTDDERAQLDELARAYEMYQKFKTEEGKLDFADLVSYVLELFRTRPHVLKHYQDQFPYILVDEFQDTNIAQYELIKLLAPDKKRSHLTVVGDDSQAIYKFRGASVSNILQFTSDYPKAEMVSLIHNYRSNQSVLDHAYRLIRNNDPDTLEVQLGISKELIGRKGDGESLQLYIAENEDEESDHIAETISRLVADKKYEYRDCAILVRASRHADPILSALNRQGIPYELWGRSALYKQPEIKELIAYLNILADPTDSASFYRVLTMEVFGLDHHDISILLAFAKKTALPLLTAAELYASFFKNEWYLPQYGVYRPHLPLFTEKTKLTLTRIIAMVRRHQNLIPTQSAGQIMYYFLEDSGYLPLLSSYTSTHMEKRAMSIARFFQIMKRLESDGISGTVAAVVEYIALSIDLGESPVAEATDAPSYNAVHVLTVHGAKGLEFPVVFLPHLVSGRFPTRKRSEQIPIPTVLIKETLPAGDDHILEERRLFYVGLTRAKDFLFLTASKMYAGGKRQRKLSPFVEESIGKDKLELYTQNRDDKKKQLTIFDFQPKAQTQIPPAAQSVVAAAAKSLKTFSYSQIETFNVCPLQYKYQYILKIPTGVSAAASFGESVHKALQLFYQEFQKDQGVGLDRLLALYEQTWIPTGYDSQKDQDHRFTRGKEMLAEFFKSFHNKYTTVLGVEKLFKIKIENGTYITGKIDRVDKHADGSIEIIDYKTGRLPDEKKLKKNSQLSIYALAASDKKLYGTDVSQITLTFYYLNDMKKISLKRTAEDIHEVKEEVKSAARAIRESAFPAKVGPWCGYCQFKINCEAWQ